MKTLIVYFSRAGHTEKVARKLKDVCGADIFEITGDKNYGGYFKALGIAKTEYNENELPAIKGDVEDFASYDKVLVGFPIWYGKCPQIVVSFIKSHDFTGKNVYLFCTSGMSKPDKAVKLIKESDLFKGATFKTAKRFGKFNEAEVKSWLEM